MIKLWVVMIFCLCSSTGFVGGEGVVRPMALPVPDGMVRSCSSLCMLTVK